MVADFWKVQPWNIKFINWKLLVWANLYLFNGCVNDWIHDTANLYLKSHRAYLFVIYYYCEMEIILKFAAFSLFFQSEYLWMTY